MIIVTGGAGFIGCNIITALNKIKYKNIYVVDNLKNGEKFKNLTHLYIADYIDKDEFIKKIRTKTIHITSYIKNIDVIFHEGACSCTTEWDGKYMMTNNYQYSKDLLHFCINKHIPLIYASSAAVYGKKTNQILSYQSHKEKPINIYGYSKFLFDQYVRTILPKIQSQVCGLRYFNVYGPYETHKGNMASIIYQLHKQIKNKKNPTLFSGSKYFKRDFIYIKDVVDINIWAWKNSISGIFDCGTGHAKSFEVIAKIILNFYNQNMTIKYISIPKELHSSYQTFTQANIYQLRTLGYRRKFTNLTQGVHQYLHWLACQDVNSEYENN